MKRKLIIASAALSTLCCIYLARLNSQAEEFAPVAAEGISALAASPQGASPTDLVSARSGEQLEDFSRRVKTKRTMLTLDAGKAAMIYGREGTGLYFEANSFVHADGSPVTGKVRIRLNECYDIASMISAKLSTTSDGQILETAGMVDIKAFSGNEEVNLKKDQRFNIYFPKNGNEENDFKLFYGEWNKDEIINWKLADNEEPIRMADAARVTKEGKIQESENVFTENFADDVDLTNVEPYQSLLGEGDYCFLQICESKLRRGTRISEMDYFNWKLGSGQTLNQWFVSNFNPDLKMLEEFCILGLRSEITFKVDEEGNFKSYYISKSCDRPDYDRAMVAFLETMPPLDLGQLMPSYNDDHACILTFGSHTGTSQENFASEFKKKHKNELDKPLKNVDASTLDYFIFSSSELGWINCDRFYENGPRVDFVVHNSGIAGGTVSMVFEDINSVLKGVSDGDRITFPGIPANKRVRLIGISSASNDPLMCVTSSNTSAQKAALKNYKPFSIIELEKQFARN